MKYAYQAVDGTGKVVGGVIDTADENEAMDALRHKGLFVGELRPATGDALAGASAGGKKGKRLGTGRRLKNMAMFTRQLSVLVSSGTPLVQALAALHRSDEARKAARQARTELAESKITAGELAQVDAWLASQP